MSLLQIGYLLLSNFLNLHINNIDFTGTVVNMVDSGQPAKVYLNASHNLVFDIPKPVLTNDDLQTLKDYVDNDIMDGKW